LYIILPFLTIVFVSHVIDKLVIGSYTEWIETVIFFQRVIAHRSLNCAILDVTLESKKIASFLHTLLTVAYSKVRAALCPLIKLPYNYNKNKNINHRST